ncbi:MAG: type II toxin-antitoxin system RelE/ParE family toxin [Desulfobacterales bacterium]|nr:type II toxin-antitoxin system RelE/ParE family toxin [Desulfobacterales bacterium]
MAEPLRYRIVISRKAEKEAEHITPLHRDRIDKAILSLAADPRPHACKKLTHKEGYRIRVGNYRVLYTVDDQAKAVVIYRIKTKGKGTYR